jgi:Flp pilus assembly protein TadD
MSTNKANKKQIVNSPEKTTKRDTMFLVALIVFSFVILSGLVTDFFLNIDDDVYFINNPFIKSLSFENIKNIFTQPYGGNYHPVTTLIEAVEYNFFKLKPEYYHFVSLIVHLLNTILVFNLTNKFFKNTQFKVIVATIFALHPMHVESVAWISDKTDLYYTFFFLLGMISYINYLQSNKKTKLIITFICFCISLLCKPAAIAFPFVLIFLDYYFGKDFRKEGIFKIPFFIITGIFAYITYFTLHVDSKFSVFMMPDYSVIETFFVANFTFCYYIFQFFFPLGLSGLHLAPAELPFYFYLTPFLTAIIFYSIFKSIKFGKEVLFGFLFYLFTIGLVLQIIPSGYTIVAERYSYLPYFGLAFIFASVIRLIEKNKISLPKTISANYKTIVYSFVGLLIILTYLRTNDWKNLPAFNISIAEENPNSAYAQLAAAYQGIAINDGVMTRKYLENAEGLNEDDPDVAMIKAKAYFKLEEHKKALDNFKKAQKLHSKDKELEVYLARSYFFNNRFDSSEVYFSKVILSDSVPNIENLRSRAICNFYLNDFEKAIADYNTIANIDAKLGYVYSERGVCFQKLNRLDLACADWKKAIEFGYDECQKDIDAFCK